MHVSLVSNCLVFLKSSVCVCVCVWVCGCVCVCAQSCPTLCDLMDCSPPGSSVHRIFQARILEWVAIFYSRGSSQPRENLCLPHLLGWQADSLPLCHLGSPKGLLLLYNYSHPLVSTEDWFQDPHRYQNLWILWCNTVGLPYSRLRILDTGNSWFRIHPTSWITESMILNVKQDLLNL